VQSGETPLQTRKTKKNYVMLNNGLDDRPITTTLLLASLYSVKWCTVLTDDLKRCKNKLVAYFKVSNEHLAVCAEIIKISTTLTSPADDDKKNKQTNKLRGPSPGANYIDRTTAVYRRS
jgi:hypothetical protein